MRRILISLFLIAGCQPGTPGKGDNTYPSGQTEFITTEPGSNGNRSDTTAGGTTGGAPASGEAAPAADNRGAPMGRTGTVEEADIYRIDQNRLFYFSTYRGFIIYDLTDPKKPTKVSRLPVFGYPVEMYVDGNVVYALIRDALYLTQDEAGAKYAKHDVSQLLAIDVSDLANPKLIKSIDIIGQLREGVSRKIDDTIYVVSYIPQGYYGWWWWDWGWYGQIDTDKEQAWVYSFNVMNPADPLLIDKLKIFEGGGYNVNGSGTSASRWFQGVAISATSNTLHVVENWYTYGWVSGSPYNCGNSYSQQQAVVSIVDISDPTGKIRLHSKFDTYGHLGDQFKQTYVYDEATKKGHYFGIFARQEWGSSGCTGSQFIRNALEAWDITDGANPKRVSTLPFGKENETVGGSVFDTDRKVAYAITSRRIDPFYALDFSDPTNLKIRSAVDGLSGDMSVFRFINDKKFIIGIGRDNSEECTGFGANSTRWRTGIAVSIFDVQNLDAIRLVQRRCVDVDNAEWVTSEISWNLDQAHKMIGMHSDALANVITVPVSYYTKTDEQNWWWYRYQSAVGMMTWNLGVYDPNKSELDQTVLTTHGTVLHPNGGVRRTIVFTHQSPTGNRRMMLNLSDTHLSMFDIQNVDAPVQQSAVEVAPNVEAIFRFGDYMVEHLRADGYGYGYDTASEFRIKKVGGVLDETAPAFAFTVGQVQRVMKWKDALLVFRSIPATATTGRGGYPYDYSSSQLVVYDLANPAQPRLRSLTTLPYSVYPYYWFWCGDGLGYFGGWWWGGANSWASFDGGLAFSTYAYDYNTNTSSTNLVFVNLADLGAPLVKTHALGTTDRQILALTTDGTDPKGFYLTYRDVLGVLWPNNYWAQTQYKYYAQRWSVAGDDVQADAATNVPGQIVRSWKSGNRTFLLTQNSYYTWVPNPQGGQGGWWDADPMLHLLVRANDSTAVLKDSYRFADRWLGSLVGDGDRVYVTSSKQYNYYYPAYDTTSTSTSSTAAVQEDRSDQLTIFDTAAETLARPYEATTGLTGVQAMGALGQRLYLRVSGAGVLVLDVANGSAPLGRSFLRTLGWGSHLEFSGSTLYVAAGNFGVFQKSLDALTTLAP